MLGFSAIPSTGVCLRAGPRVRLGRLGLAICGTHLSVYELAVSSRLKKYPLLEGGGRLMSQGVKETNKDQEVSQTHKI